MIRSPAELDEQMLDQAIAWLVRLQSGQPSAETLAACQAWRLADSRHEELWQELQLSDAPFQTLTQRPARLALDTLQGMQQQRQDRRQVLKLLGVGGLLLGAGGLALNTPSLRADYATRTGERRQLELADGTRLHLNTQTAVRIDFNAERRAIDLLQGEIFVVTGDDSRHRGAGRSFWINSGPAQLQAIGSAFSVRRDDQHSRLHVSQGIVEINGQLRANAGERYLIDAQQRLKLSTTSMDPDAWTRGQLLARRMRLSELAAELSRYRSGWLSCDAAVADLQVSGVLQLDDIDHGLDALSQTLPIRVQRFTRYWTRLIPA